MSARPMKIPGPDHPITVQPSSKHVVVTVAGQVVADSRHALELREASYPVTYYIPRSDTRMDLLDKTEHATHCPYKGEASYFSIPAGGARSANAIWSYEHPHAAVAEIKEHLAFYPDRVDAIAVTDD